MSEKSVKSYLVTGAAGFIGSNFVDFLLRHHGPEAVRITVLDAFTYAGNAASLADALQSGSVDVVRGDIGDAALTASLMEQGGFDYVVNFAAESHVDRSISDPGIFVRTNIEGTRVLLDSVRHAWHGHFDDHRFLQVGTDEVYGSLPLEWPEGREVTPGVRAYGPGAFTEEMPLQPRSPYSATKAAADMLALAYHSTFGLPVIVTRCSNNYGPRQFPEKLIPLMINNLLEDKQIPVYGDGLNVRDWLFVDDHCAAIDAALHIGRPGRVYNIGGHNERTNLEIVNTVIACVADALRRRPDLAPGVDPSTITPDRITFVTDRPGHDRRYAIDSSRATAELQWQPKVHFADGIRRTVDWYLTHGDWMRQVISGEYRRFCNELYDKRPTK